MAVEVVNFDVAQPFICDVALHDLLAWIENTKTRVGQKETQSETREQAKAWAVANALKPARKARKPAK